MKRRTRGIAPGIDGEQRVYTVGELTGEVKDLLETAHPYVAVKGEISNFHPHGSGHIYFTLKDERAQLKAAFFRGAVRGLKFQPENGMEVIAFGRLSVYEARGEYQIIVESLEPAGLGALQAKIEQLKKKLEAEGLFDPYRKQLLPEIPIRVALVTSPEGAAIRDFLKVTRRRFPGQHITIFPVLVQGEEAAAQVSEAIDYANEYDDFDVIVVCRGGGSLEDLMAFNSEEVARSIAGSGVPVVTGIGHERDVTIADLVADVRASTPSQAAELVTPSREGFLDLLEATGARLGRLVRGIVEDAAQAVDDLGDGMRESVVSALEDGSRSISELDARLRASSPRQVLARRREMLGQLASRVSAAGSRTLSEARHVMGALAGRLEALSPLAVLGRGYAICFALPARVVVKDAAAVAPGQEIEVRLMKGTLSAFAGKPRKEG